MKGQHFWQSLFGNRPFEKGAHSFQPLRRGPAILLRTPCERVVFDVLKSHKPISLATDPLKKGLIFSASEKRTSKFVENPLGKGRMYLIKATSPQAHCAAEPLQKGSKQFAFEKGHIQKIISF